MTKQQAIQELETLAEYASNENYHEHASMLWTVIDRVRELSVQALVIVPDMYGGVDEYVIEP